MGREQRFRNVHGCSWILTILEANKTCLEEIGGIRPEPILILKGWNPTVQREITKSLDMRILATRILTKRNGRASSSAARRDICERARRAKTVLPPRHERDPTEKCNKSAADLLKLCFNWALCLRYWHSYLLLVAQLLLTLLFLCLSAARPTCQKVSAATLWAWPRRDEMTCGRLLKSSLGECMFEPFEDFPCLSRL